MANQKNKSDQDKLTVEDEPGMAERFQRALRKALNTPPKPRPAPTQKPKERSASKGRVHKGKTRS